MNPDLFTDEPAPEAALFTDEPAPTYMQDLGSSALKEAKGMFDPRDKPGMLEGIDALTAIPSGGIPNVDQMKKLMEMGKAAPGAALNMAKDAGSELVDTISNPVEHFRQKPISTTVNAASLIFPFLKGAPEAGGIAEGLAKSMENQGGEMAADLANLESGSVHRMKPDMMLDPDAVDTVQGKANPSSIRQESGKRLVKEGIVGGVGQETGDMWHNAALKEAEFGQGVERALDDIRKTNRATGEYDDVPDATHQQATPILKSILDKANELKADPHSGQGQQSRFWRETYNSLANKANKNNGMLSIDDIRDEMQAVGKDLEGSDKSPRGLSAKERYGHLADLRDQMVNDIAEQSGDQRLSRNLRIANKGYSFYHRIMKGLTNAGESGETGAPNPNRAIYRGAPIRAGLYATIRALKPALAEKLVNGGPTMAKYGGILEAAAKKGPQNLAMAEFVLRQQHPDYDQAVK